MVKEANEGETHVIGASGAASGTQQHAVDKPSEIQLVDVQSTKIKTWLDSLSTEELENLSIIQDDAFMVMILDIFSQSWSAGSSDKLPGTYDLQTLAQMRASRSLQVEPCHTI
jgi:hypothetical protein